MPLSRRGLLLGVTGLPTVPLASSCSASQEGGAEGAIRSVAGVAGRLATVVVRNADPAAPLPAGAYVGFGHPFAAGDVPTSRHPELRLAGGTPVPLQQCDNEARSHPDGSLAFATFALALPAAVRPGGALGLAVCAADGPKAQPPSGLAAGPLQDRGYQLQLATGGVAYAAALAEALAAPTARVLADGPVCKEWRGLAPFRDPQGAPHPDLWCRFYARLHRDGATLRLAAQAVNGWMGDGRNHDLDGAALLGPAGPLPGFAWGPFRHTYHSAWFAFDADALPYWSAGRPAFSVGLDPAYAARARAAWDYMPGLADAIGTPARQDYSKVKPPGYDPAYVPGDPAGYTLWVANYGDDRDRGEIGPVPSWGVAHLLKGTPDWARYDRVHALALATAPVLYHAPGGEVPVLTATAYPGLAPPAPTAGWGPAGSVRNPPADPPSHSNSGGWHGTDDNTPGRAPRMDSSHWPGGAMTSWLIAGDPWFVDLLVSMAVHHVGVVAPDEGYRKATLGGAARYGLVVVRNEVRGKAWAMRDLDNAAWLCPDAHPAKRYLQDLCAANWGYFEAAMDAGAITSGQQALGCVVVGPGDFLVANYNTDFVATSAAMALRRGRPGTAEFWAVFGRWVYGRAGGGGTGGCPYRASAHVSVLREGPAAPWFTSFAQVRVGLNNHDPIAGKVPLVPAEGCPSAGQESKAEVPFWLGWWSYAGGYGANSYAAIEHMGAACGAVAGIAGAAEVEAYLARQAAVVPLAHWAACPRYAIRPPATY